MPRVTDDIMVDVPEDLKEVIRRIGIPESARLIAKSESFIRSIISKGPKRMKRSELLTLETMGR